MDWAGVGQNAGARAHDFRHTENVRFQHNAGVTGLSRAKLRAML